jgi:general secretion pathway protein D
LRRRSVTGSKSSQRGRPFTRGACDPPPKSHHESLLPGLISSRRRGRGPGESEKEIALNTSSRIVAAWVGASLAVASASAWASGPSSTVSALCGLAAVGQAPAGGRSPEEARKQVDDLLSKARQSMKEGNFETADSLIGRAESIPLSFGIIHMGDTPKKARRDFIRLRGGPAASPKKPSELFAPTKGKETAPKPSAGVRDPFARRPDAFEPTMDRPAADTGMAGEPGVIDAPPADDPLGALPDPRAFPEESPFGKKTMTAPPADDQREPGLPTVSRTPTRQTSDDLLRDESGKLLLASRRALAVGDVRRAMEFINQAKTLDVQYDFQDDSPTKVEAVIQRYAQIGSKGGSPQSESFRRRKAESFLEQAEGLLVWHEFDEAERLVESAGRLNVVYGPADARPEALAQRIAAARRGGAAGGRVEPLPPIDRMASPAAAQGAAGEPADQQKQQVQSLVAQAKAALAAGDLDRAAAVAEQAENLGVPDAAFGQNDERPWEVLLRIQRLRQEQRNVKPAGGVTAIATDEKMEPAANQAVYDRDHDPTHNVPATAQDAVNTETGMDLFQRGEQALRDHDRATALRWFRQANLHRADLDPVSQQRLQDALQFLSRPQEASKKGAGDGSLLAETAAAQQLKYRQVTADLARKEQAASKLRETSPKQAKQALEECRSLVENAHLDKAAHDILLRRVDKQLEDLDRFVNANRGRIELNERNDAVRGEIERERQAKVEVQQKLADLVDEFNTLMHEKRFAEAEVVYKRAAEIAPDELVVQQLKNMVKMVARTEKYNEIRNAKEEGFLASMNNAEKAAVPFDDNDPYQHGDVKDWKKLTETRREWMQQQSNRKTERDIEIEKKLRTPVWLKYKDAPLSQVVEDLGKLAQIPTHLDMRGLVEEGVDTNTPVTINLTSEISLKSALHLILEPLHLSYVIKDEVLKITSEQMRDGEVLKKVYNVADLVIPIPNFVPNSRMGLSGALQDAQANLPNNWAGLSGDSPMPVAASATGAGASAMVDPRSMLAQMSSASAASISPASATSLAGSGPGGLGGGTQADFESLIELITSTVAPTTWDDVGGPGSVQKFQGNLSLVISQTQEVHEEIADLLEQLRRLQDLQVTIEVRFITLNDNFFERIGVNFDFEIPTYPNKPFQLFGSELNDTVIPNSPSVTAFPPPYTNNNVAPIDLRSQQGTTVGLSPGPTGSVLYSSDLDIPFQQGSFGLASPQFGGYQAGAGATLGFAILSNIEAYFLMEASQGDRRSNVLQAPKVTLFNGQQAAVFDVTQTPFVISVIPVVGAFAAAQQPVIIVLNEGTALTVQAVISHDRRFVRLTLIPFFSHITQVNTFTFTGSSTTTQNSDSEGPSDNTTTRKTSQTSSAQGTTVQLPSFSFFSVATTVSVPDGGTVLLGGVKRLSEGRNEFGVPILSKIPYVNRLFKNVGIGRETQSLMMMVTPRIIIQEEEEALLGIPSTP